MRNGTPHIAALKRTLVMLEAVIRDGGASSVSGLAESVGLPIATAHRQVATLVAQGYLAPLGRGRHVAGSALRGLVALIDDKQLLVNAAAAPLHHLATQTQAVAQLGTFEQDMVTYRLKFGQGAEDLFTKIGMQLEAYCSGIGKVLLAYLPPSQQAAYLAGGPFVALTARTLTQPDDLARDLGRIAARGYAIDHGEIAEGLYCLAVPVRNTDGTVVAAISVSQSRDDLDEAEILRLLTRLQATAATIESAMAGRAGMRQRSGALPAMSEQADQDTAGPQNGSGVS